MRSAIFLCVTLLTLGCGPGISGAAGEPLSLELAQAGVPGDVSIRRGETEGALAADFDAPIGEVWAVLPGAFRTLGFSIDAADPSTRVLGVQDLVVREITGKLPASFLECGNGVTGANANRYLVTLTLLAQARELGSASVEVQVLVDATARDMSTSGSPLRCASNGNLEQLLLNAVGELTSADGAQ